MIERIKISYANCYLLSGEGGSILIDTCNYKDGEQILARVKDRNVRLILLTHCHFDHVGSAKFLADRLNVPIAMSGKDLHLLGRGELSVLHAATPLGKLFSFFSQPVLKKAGYSLFKPDVLLEDGQSLTDFGVKACIVALPGHTKGSVGVLTDEGGFVVGDAMFNLLRPTAARIYEDAKEMHRSVDKIRASGADTIFVGHGKPIKNR